MPDAGRPPRPAVRAMAVAAAMASASEIVFMGDTSGQDAAPRMGGAQILPLLDCRPVRKRKRVMR